MTYQVKNSAGDIIATVPDKKTDTTTTSLSLVGYNSIKYGLSHAENFVHLLEHFANETPPLAPIRGQLWFDITTNTMKVYSNGGWSPVSSATSVGDPNQGGIAGVYHCPLPLANSSALLMFAGGVIVAVTVSKDIPQSALPASVRAGSSEYVLQAMFPFGLQGGVNLADSNTFDEPNDLVFSGRVPLAEQSHFSGGGATDTEVSGWGYLDMGPGKSVGLMIANGAIVAAVAQAYVLYSDLPESITIQINKDRQNDPCTLAVRAAFSPKVYKQWSADSSGNPIFDPAQNINNVALFPGLTFADSTNGGINQVVNSVVASASTAYGNALASAISETKVWVDNNSATALKVSEINAAFTTQTGTTSIASAVSSIIARASDNGASAALVNQLAADFTSALGGSSFGDAMNRLSVVANASGTQSEAITDIRSAFTNKFGGSSFAQAVNNLYTSVDSAGKNIAGWGLSLNSNGYVTGIEAFNGGASNNFFKVTASKFVIGDNNIDFIPFQIVNGTVYMKNVVAENITYNSLIPALGGNYNRLRSDSGFQIFPGGFIIQWGRVRRTIREEQTFGVSFPMAFPGGVMSVTAMPFISYFSDIRDLWMQNTGEPSLTGAVFSTQAATGKQQYIDGFDWMAFGY